MLLAVSRGRFAPVAALVQGGLGSMINSYSDPHWLAVIIMDKCTEL